MKRFSLEVVGRRYPEAFDWTAGVRHPVDDGVFKVDVRTGKKRLLVSFKQLADALRPRRPDVDDQELFINHTLNNRESDRIFLFVRAILTALTASTRASSCARTAAG